MTQDFNSEAEALDAFLRGELPADDHTLPAEDKELAATLRATAQSLHADPQFQDELEARLRRAMQNKRPPPLQSFARSLGWVAAAGMLVVLAFSLAWVLRNLLPQPVSPAATSAKPTSLATPTVSAVDAEQPTQALVASGTPGPAVYSIPFMPGFELELQAEFPESPAQASVFTLETGEPPTVENVKAMAAQLGVQGNVYQKTGELVGKMNFVVSDGKSRITFLDSPRSFYYISDFTTFSNQGGALPPVEQRISAAEEFLQSHGLLDFTYQVETDNFQPGSVRFVPIVDGHPLKPSTFNPSLIDVEINAQGQVKAVNYTMPILNSLGQYPIRSVEEAWESVLSSETSRGIQNYEWTVSPSDIKIWQREYPIGQRVELFGYLEVLESAEPGVSALLMFNNYPLAGNVQGLAESIGQGVFSQIWGNFQESENDLGTFNVEGWQVSPFEDKSVEGVIRRQGDRAYLQAAEGEYLLAELPASVTEGEKVAVRGVVLEQPELTLDWSSITTAVGFGGGGGGGGGLAFGELNLSGTPIAMPTPAPTAMPPVQVGERIEKERGHPFVTLHVYPDGSLIQETSIFFLASDDLPDGLFVFLEGSSLAGIENYMQLPVYVWGTITGEKNKIPVLTVERYEPVYPGLRIQSWVGTEEIVEAEGTYVILFTTQEGEKYVLNSSIDVEPDEKVGPAGALVIIEGVQEPDKMFGGYPAINDHGRSMADKITNLSQYPLYSATPVVIQEANLPGVPGVATIKKIELVYYGPEANDAPGIIPYVQPVWRFAGSYSDGRQFEIIVQALRDEYLK